MTVSPLAPGVWGVVATPFAGPTREVDPDSLTRLVRHLAASGVTGLTVLGVFGEQSRLSTAERELVLRTVVDAMDLPLVVGASGLATAPVTEEVTLARDLVGDRLAGAMIQVNSPDPRVLTEHLSAVHTATGAGLVVQDYPVSSGVSIGSAALIAALRETPGVVAVKAEAPPTAVAIAAIRAAVDVPVFGGLGGIGLLDELAAGAAGAMTGFSFPEALVACVSAWREGGYDAARAAFLPYLPLVTFEQQPGIALAVRKECLRRRGLIDDAAVRPPAPGLPESLGAQLARHLAAVPVPAEV